MSVITKDLGAVTAYAAAVNRGYTGTKEEFETLMASYATVAQQAAESASNASQSAQSASQSATDAETAKGTAQQAATDAQTAQTSAQGFAQSAQQSAQSASQSAQNAESAKDTAVNAVDGFAAGAQQALDGVNQAGVNWKSLAQAKALDSEAWAVGTRDGEDVGTQDETYHNNAKYYAEQGSASAQTATEAAQTATTKASEAQASASQAAESARTLTIDPTLTQSGQAADAKATGDEITGLKEDVAVAVNITPNWESVSLTLQNGYYYKDTGKYYEANDRRSVKINVTVGSKYKLSTYTRSAVISGIMFFDSDDVVVGTLLDGTGTGVVIANYEFTIPVGVASMAVQSADAAQAIPILYVYEEEKEFVGYTKTEVDEKISTIPKKYGVKWEISNPDDLGQRCFDAIGLTASIGIGSTNGQSDFDAIYPWSEIKRCNIKQNTNGAKIVTFEGETGFSLDGSNGDVFVRIPKFYYERYRKDGYEYRVISASGVNPHPAFVEENKVLDEIFVGAFEGSISSSKLRSIGGMIPSSNETAQTFLDAAQANGDGYTIYDMRTVDAVWTLMAVEFGCRNTNQIIGYGFADFLQPAKRTYGVECDTAGTTNTFSASKSIPAARIALMPVGSNCTICKDSQLNVIASRKITEITSDANHWYISFDGDPIELDTTCFIGSAGCTTNFCETAPSGALTWHTGRANWVSGSNTKNPVRYRWMENLVGSLWHLLPDVIFKDLQMYVCNDIAKYAIDATSSAYTPIGDLLLEQASNGSKSDVPDANYWITDLNDFSFGKSYDFGKTWDMSLLSTQAFGAFYYLSSGTKITANGGGFDHLYRCNMLTQRAWISPSDKWYLYGARLLYKHLT